MGKSLARHPPVPNYARQTAGDGKSSAAAPDDYRRRRDDDDFGFKVDGVSFGGGFAGGGGSFGGGGATGDW